MRLERNFDLSRDPSDYEASDHLNQRLRSGGERTVVDYDMVAEAIEEGEVERVDDNGTVLRHEWLMTTFEVVISRIDGKVQTAYEVEG